MFGTPMYTTWAVLYTRNGDMYYLSTVNDNTTTIVWTKQKGKCKKYASNNEASKCMEYIKANHKDKNLKLSVIQA